MNMVDPFYCSGQNWTKYLCKHKTFKVLCMGFVFAEEILYSGVSNLWFMVKGYFFLSWLCSISTLQDPLGWHLYHIKNWFWLKQSQLTVDCTAAKWTLKYIVLQCSEVQCNVPQYIAVQFSVPQYIAVQYSLPEYIVVQFSVPEYIAVQ